MAKSNTPQNKDRNQQTMKNHSAFKFHHQTAATTWIAYFVICCLSFQYHTQWLPWFQTSWRDSGQRTMYIINHRGSLQPQQFSEYQWRIHHNCIAKLFCALYGSRPPQHRHSVVTVTFVHYMRAASSKVAYMITGPSHNHCLCSLSVTMATIQ